MRFYPDIIRVRFYPDDVIMSYFSIFHFPKCQHNSLSPSTLSVIPLRSAEKPKPIFFPDPAGPRGPTLGRRTSRSARAARSSNLEPRKPVAKPARARVVVETAHGVRRGWKTEPAGSGCELGPSLPPCFLQKAQHHETLRQPKACQRRSVHLHSSAHTLCGVWLQASTHPATHPATPTHRSCR